MKKAWIYVALTCLFEWIWVYGFNTAHSWWEWAIVVGVILLDYHILPKACEFLPTGTVYAIFLVLEPLGPSSWMFISLERVSAQGRSSLSS